jgi:hypothetical protein
MAEIGKPEKEVLVPSPFETPAPLKEPVREPTKEPVPAR